MKLLFTFLILLVNCSLFFSQPGGGGGLYIQNIFGPDLTRIDLLSDTDVIFIRTFLLYNNKLHHETFVYQNPGRNAFRNRARYEKKDGLFLPPFSGNDSNRDHNNNSDQRVLLVLRGDTLMIDFLGITGENGAGHFDTMDSLVFKKGYYIYHRAGFKNAKYNYEALPQHAQLLQNGFTPHTVLVLSPQGNIISESEIDLSFLSEKNLPASYYLQLARYLLNKNATDSVLQAVNKGLAKNNKIKNCEIIFLYTDAFKALNQVENAIAAISEGMDCKRYEGYEESKADNFSERAELYIQLSKFDKALADLNSMVQYSENKLHANIKRAEFKEKYLNDYKGAISDLKKDIASIPADHNRAQPNVISNYNETYFALGTALYHNKEFTEAFSCWLKAMRFGYAQTSDDFAVVHFDSIIKVHPTVAENYLSRAIANYKRGPFLGWSNKTKEVFQKALEDINKAEELGLKDYRINFYRANVLNLLKKNTEALKEINEAIKKNADDPFNYQIRYNVRRDLGQTKWGEKDNDLVRFQELSETWKFEK